MLRKTAVGVAVLALMMVGPVARAGRFYCGGTAPVVTNCSNGVHTFTGSLSQGAAWDSNFTGTIVGRFTFTDGRVQELRQHVVAGGLSGFERKTIDSFIAPGSVYTHDCYANIVRTDVPGAIGWWNCGTTT